MDCLTLYTSSGLYNGTTHGLTDSKKTKLAFTRSSLLLPAVFCRQSVLLTTTTSTASLLPAYRSDHNRTRTMSSTSGKSFYDLEADMPKGDKLSMAQLKGKVVLIVNVASKCGFTPQYTGLEELYKKYHDQGLEIIGFPCNQPIEHHGITFVSSLISGFQEPGSDEAIATFCSATYPVTFPIAKKSNVNGSDANEVFKWLKEQKEGKGLLTNAIKWNFTKFLCSKDGEVIKRYGSSTAPADIEEDIKKALAA